MDLDLLINILIFATVKNKICKTIQNLIDMKKNSFIVFSGKEMFRLLVRNKYNRAVSKSDYKNNDYFAASSVSRGEKRVNGLVKSIADEGWKNLTVYVYKKDGWYILLDGNTRREALDVCVERKILDDYPTWYAIDLSCETNPNTGKPYTFEEAQEFVEFANIHAQKAHTATDIFEAHAKMGSEMCQVICDLANAHNMPTTIVADLMSDIHGSSKENNVMRVVEMAVDEEHRKDVEAILDVLDTLDNNRTESIPKSFKREYHCVHAIKNVYRFCKHYGVADEFCSLMKIASTMRKPNPFLHFFDTAQTAAMIDQLLYMIDSNAYFKNAGPKTVRSLASTISSALTAGGAMKGVSEFHTDFRFKKKNIILDSYYKKAV